MRKLRACFFAAAACIIAITATVQFSYADTAAQQAALQAQLDQINQQIAQNQKQLGLQQQQRASLERDVAILDSQIKVAKLQIKQRDLTIQTNQDAIAKSQAGIADLDSRVAGGQESLAQILRETNQIDSTAFIELLLNNSVSDALQDLDDFKTVHAALEDAFTKMATQRSDLAARKQALEDQNQQEGNLLQAQKVQQAALLAAEAQEQSLISKTRGQESIYQQLIANQQQTAAQIKAQLFSLNGASHSTSFGDMYQYAKEASVKTGVRPAVILAILREETNLGQNVGTGNWRVDMKTPRDTVPFQQICSALGLNPDSQPVSKRQSYGYGGAMGPAQFIPSTWVLYQDRIARASGQTNPNPWDPRTATFAAAILMMDNGADAQTYSSERIAALKYLAGSGWNKAAYAFYGDAVMGFASEYQKDIDVLGG